jgi:threonine dehydratase
MNTSIECIPELRSIRSVYDRIGPYIAKTPTYQAIRSDLPFSLALKLEFLQNSGTFKLRGALANVLCGQRSLNDLRATGIVAVSAGNHAIATAYVGKVLSIPTTVIMPKQAATHRVSKCIQLGAQVEIVKTAEQGFALVENLRASQGMLAIPPFSGELVTLGTAGVGLEIFQELPNPDVVLVAVGGGGLASGIATAAHRLAPDCEVIGIEPEGADVMRQSIAAGKPLNITCAPTIADTLAPPLTMQYSFDICSRLLSRIEIVSDSQILGAMRDLYDRHSFAVEPACAATYAAATGPLKDYLTGKSVIAILCGSNQSVQSFSSAYMGDGGGSGAIEDIAACGAVLRRASSGSAHYCPHDGN